MPSGGSNKKLTKQGNSHEPIAVEELPFLKKPDPKKWTRHKIQSYFSKYFQDQNITTSELNSVVVSRLTFAAYIAQRALQAIDEDPISPLVGKKDAYLALKEQMTIMSVCMVQICKCVLNIHLVYEQKTERKSPTEHLRDWEPQE